MALPKVSQEAEVMVRREMKASNTNSDKRLDYLLAIARRMEKDNPILHEFLNKVIKQTNDNLVLSSVLTAYRLLEVQAKMDIESN